MRNLGISGLLEIMGAEGDEEESKWRCFSCDESPLRLLQRHCDYMVRCKREVRRKKQGRKRSQTDRMSETEENRHPANKRRCNGDIDRRREAASVADQVKSTSKESVHAGKLSTQAEMKEELVSDSECEESMGERAGLHAASLEGGGSPDVRHGDSDILAPNSDGTEDERVGRVGGEADVIRESPSPAREAPGSGAPCRPERDVSDNESSLDDVGPGKEKAVRSPRKRRLVRCKKVKVRDAPIDVDQPEDKPVPDGLPKIDSPVKVNMPQLRNLSVRVTRARSSTVRAAMAAAAAGDMRPGNDDETTDRSLRTVESDPPHHKIEEVDNLVNEPSVLNVGSSTENDAASPTSACSGAPSQHTEGSRRRKQVRPVKYEAQPVQEPDEGVDDDERSSSSKETSTASDGVQSDGDSPPKKILRSSVRSPVKPSRSTRRSQHLRSEALEEEIQVSVTVVASNGEEERTSPCDEARSSSESGAEDISPVVATRGGVSPSSLTGDSDGPRGNRQARRIKLKRTKAAQAVSSDDDDDIFPSKAPGRKTTRGGATEVKASEKAKKRTAQRTRPGEVSLSDNDNFVTIAPTASAHKPAQRSVKEVTEAEKAKKRKAQRTRTCSISSSDEDEDSDIAVLKAPARKTARRDAGEVDEGEKAKKQHKSLKDKKKKEKKFKSSKKLFSDSSDGSLFDSDDSDGNSNVGSDRSSVMILSEERPPSGGPDSEQDVISSSEGDSSLFESSDGSEEVIRIRPSKRRTGAVARKDLVSLDGGTPRVSKGKNRARRRIKELSSSSDESSGGGSGGEEEQESTPHGKRGRRKIAKIMEDSKLTEETRRALQEEKERLERLKKKNEALAAAAKKDGGSGEIERVILEVDPNTKEPRIEVSSYFLEHLKPHQVSGSLSLSLSISLFLSSFPTHSLPSKKNNNNNNNNKNT